MAPKYNPDSTDCLPFSRIAIGLHDGWSASERQHLAGCSRCQRLLAKGLSYTPPTRLALAAFAAGTLEWNLAMHEFLSDPDNYEYQRTLHDPATQCLAELIKAGHWLRDQVKGMKLLISQAAEATTGPALRDAAFSPAAANYRSGSAETHSLIAETRDQDLLIELVIDETWRFACSTKRPDGSGLQVQLMMVSETGKVWETKLTLDERVGSTVRADLTMMVPDDWRDARISAFFATWVS